MKVKPLVWKEYPEGQACASTILRCDYWVTRPVVGADAGRWVWSAAALERARGSADTKDAAIEAVAADYESRVLGLLSAE